LTDLIGLRLSAHWLQVEQLRDVGSGKGVMAAFLAHFAKAKGFDEINEVLKGHVPYVPQFQSLEQLAAVHEGNPIRLPR
jgi:hypothetical protein